MRVVHVVTAWPRSDQDPITPWLVSLLRRLRDRGVEAEVLAPAYRGGPDLEVEGVPVRRFRYAPSSLERLTHEETVPDRLGRAPAWGVLLPAYFGAGLAASVALGRGRPDVVHVHWPMPHALFGAALRRASGGHAALVCSYYSVEIRWVERRLRALLPLLRWSARTADEVTAISTSTAVRLRDLTGREARIVPFAAPLDGAGAAEDPPPEPFSEGGKEIRILFVGRLVERKGVEVAVRALAELRRHRPARLDVVGEGPRASRIRQVARETGVASHVRFRGRVGEAELRRLYAQCDVFVLPAVMDRKGDTEGLGVVLLEALRFGRPVVASAVGGIPDIVVPGESGWLVPPGDSRALADRILALAADPEEARRMAGRGKSWAARRFSWDRILDDLLECYASARRRRLEASA